MTESLLLVELRFFDDCNRVRGKYLIILSLDLSLPDLERDVDAEIRKIQENVKTSSIITQQNISKQKLPLVSFALSLGSCGDLIGDVI